MCVDALIRWFVGPPIHTHTPHSQGPYLQSAQTTAAQMPELLVHRTHARELAKGPAPALVS